jgi:hypothetical protein
MAIFIPGKTTCRICRRTILKTDKSIGFQNFHCNEGDPLDFFSDAVFHSDCLKNHPFGKMVMRHQKKMDRSIQKILKKQSICFICGCRATDDPCNFLAFGDLYDAEDELHLSYRGFHKTCLPDLENIDYIYQRLLQLQDSGNWKGKDVLREFEKALKSNRARE